MSPNASNPSIETAGAGPPPRWLIGLLRERASGAARNAVLVLLAATAVLLVARSYSVSFSGKADAYCVGEWLINYGGGFVRRGLGGTAIFWLARTFGVQPRLSVFALLSVCHVLTCCALGVALMRSREVSRLDLLLVLSPFALLFPAFHQLAAHRKEVLLFALAALAYLTALGSLNSTAKYVFWSSAFAALVAVHDGAIFFLPLFVFYLQTLTPAAYPIGWRALILGLPALAVFLLGYVYSSHVDIDSICTTMARYERGMWCEPSGSPYPFAASWLKATVLDGARSVASRYTISSGSLTLLLGVVGLLPVTMALMQDSRAIGSAMRSMPVPRLLFGASTAVILILFTVANDWNRWFYVLTVLLTLMHFAARTTGQEAPAAPGAQSS